uniref:Uncharacterized protein n=1 Tax=Rhizophora mucronata TaxID=61149 RepID=A0A2P2NQX9_RHIMU
MSKNKLKGKWIKPYSTVLMLSHSAHNTSWHELSIKFKILTPAIEIFCSIIY